MQSWAHVVLRAGHHHASERIMALSSACSLACAVLAACALAGLHRSWSLRWQRAMHRRHHEALPFRGRGAQQRPAQAHLGGAYCHVATYDMHAPHPQKQQHSA